MRLLLQDLLRNNIETFGEYPLIFFQGQTYTNRDTERAAARIAAMLFGMGVTKGDRVMVCMPNLPEVFFIYQGITRTGAVIVPVMYLLHAREIEFIARNSGTQVIFTSVAVLGKIREAFAASDSAPTVVVVDDDAEPSDLARPEVSQIHSGSVRVIRLSEVTRHQLDGNTQSVVSIQESDPAVILYTSGTTGAPKGVILTHKNLYSNAVSSASINDGVRGTTLGVLPLAHIYGLTMSSVLFLTGSSVVVFPKFNVTEVFAAIQCHRVRSFSAVPAMIHAMLADPSSGNYDLSSLEWVGSGSAPMPVALASAFREKFSADVYEGYGLSEASPVVTAHRHGMAHKPGSVGVPIPGVEIRIVDEDGREMPVGEVGELLVKGDNVTIGYFQNSEETSRVLDGPWLHTGDLAKVDEEGYLYIVDRKKDVIIRGGFNIYPRDLEELLMEHPAVSEVAVVGCPSPRLGEEVVAYVVRKPGSLVNEMELLKYCQDHLAKYKTPQVIVFVDSLPRNGVGKVLKRTLRDMAAVMPRLG